MKRKLNTALGRDKGKSRTGGLNREGNGRRLQKNEYGEEPLTFKVF